MSTLTIANLTCTDSVEQSSLNARKSKPDGTVVVCLDKPNTLKLTLATTGDPVKVKSAAKIVLTFHKAKLAIPASLTAPAGWTYSSTTMKDLCITRSGSEMDIISASPLAFEIAGVTADTTVAGSHSLHASFTDFHKAPRDTEYTVLLQKASADANKNLQLICSFDQETGGDLVYVGPGVKNDRSFTIEYDTTEDLPKATSNTQITVWFDSCSEGKEPRALATGDKIAQIKLKVEGQDGVNWSLPSPSPDNENRWHLTPAEGQPVIKSKGSIRISVSDIESLQDAGRSNMYIQFLGIDGYNDCTIFVPIDKVGPYRFVMKRDQVEGVATDEHGVPDRNVIDLWTDYTTSTPSAYGPLQKTNLITIPKDKAKDIDPQWQEPQPLPVVSGGLVLLRPTTSQTPMRIMFRIGDDALNAVQITLDGAELGNAGLNSDGKSVQIQGLDEVHILEIAGGTAGIYQRLPVRFLQVQAGQEYADRDFSNMDLSGVDLSRHTIFVNAILSKASLKGTNLSGADVGGADFKGAMIDSATVWTTSTSLTRKTWILSRPRIQGCASD